MISYTCEDIRAKDAVMHKMALLNKLYSVSQKDDPGHFSYNLSRLNHCLILINFWQKYYEETRKAVVGINRQQMYDLIPL